LVALSDTHGGNRLGLLNPDTVLFEEGEAADLEPYQPNLSTLQQYLWGLYDSDVQSVLSLARRDPIIILHVGDVCEGSKHPALLVSNRKANQYLIGEANLGVWLKHRNVKAVRLAASTPAHSFGQATSDVMVAELLKRKHPKVDIKTVYHGELEVGKGGMRVNYAHKGPGPGIRDHTKGNVVRYYLRDRITRAWKRGELAARLWIRGHYHSYVRETAHERLGGEFDTFDLFLLPSYCGMGEYARGATKAEEVQTHGLVAFEIVKDRLVGIHPFLHTLDVRTREVV
jgi:hypothetical protein